MATGQDYYIKLGMYATILEGRVTGEKTTLEFLPEMRHAEDDVARSMREPVARVIVAYESALRKLYELFPTVRPVSDFDLRVRTKNCLDNACVERIGDLTSFTRQEFFNSSRKHDPLQGWKGGAGKRTMGEIEDKLFNPYDLGFRENE
jgi:hypothetical protein